MRLRVLIVPDKFKGTLSAGAAAAAISRGWLRARPGDRVAQLPMSDGGDGFGRVMSALLRARRRRVKTVDAAHRSCHADWWLEPKTRTAIIESANVIGLAMLPRGKFHPFRLDTLGLGAVLRAAWRQGARRTLVGIGGSATNDGGFGLARAVGWKFLRADGTQITRWTDLSGLAEVRAPESRGHGKVVVAVDVRNPLLGARGATRIYGPQKGLRPRDFAEAEVNLKRLAQLVARARRGLRVPGGPRGPKKSLHLVPGAGAAGGLGFGLAAFLGAMLQPGFELFAKRAALWRRLRAADLVITGEGAIDRSTAMGKGVGQIARRCQELGIPCVGLAGVVVRSREVRRLFTQVHALEDVTTPAQARARPTLWLQRLAERTARNWIPSLGLNSNSGPLPSRA